MPQRFSAYCRHLLVAVALLPGITPVAGAPPSEATDRVIVKWRDEPRAAAAADAEVRDLGRATGVTLNRLRGIGGGMQLLRLDRERSPEELAAVLATLRSDPRVQFAEPDRRVHAHAYVPNDPLFTGQWYLQATQIAATRASDAWDITRGGTSAVPAPVVIALIDTGVRPEHPDLAGKLLPGYDFISADKAGVYQTANDGDGWDADPTDTGDFLSSSDLSGDLYRGKGCGGGTDHEQPTRSSWHGTRVAGLIAANSDNGTGITGLAFNLRMLPLRALGKCGGYDSDVLAAMYWAAGMSIPAPLLSGAPPANANPAQIINMSLGGTGACSASYSTAVRDITAHGVLIVVSAGNEGAPVDSPANCAGALGVGGLRHAGTKVGYSNLGPQVGIAAPAGNCVNIGPLDPCEFTLDTTTNAGITTPGASTYTDAFTTANYGTSFSAPLVAASAGLMRAVNSHLTPSLLVARLRSSAAAFPTVSNNTVQPPACHVPTGASDLQDEECICTTAVCGAGMLDTAAAVVAALRPAAVATYSGTIGTGLTLTLDGSASGAAETRGPLAYSWTVAATTGGATAPSFATPTAAVTTVQSPVAGSYTARLTVTDAFGATDAADVTLVAATSGGTGSSTSPPPATGNGGGGAFGLLSLLLIGGACAAVGRRRLC